MAKQKTEVDRAKLQAAIDKAEEKGPLMGRTNLWLAVSAIYNADNPPAPITPSVVYLRFEEMNLTCKTPVGKKGRSGPMTEEQKAAMAEARQSVVRKSRGEKMASLPGAEKHFQTLRDITPKSLHGLVDRVEKGSLTAAIKLLCVQCMGFEKKNVWDCRGFTCPMYLHRPYQKAGDSEAPEEGDNDGDAVVEGEESKV